MADRPITFRAPMVRALLDGRKTQDRRILKVQPPDAPAPRCAPANSPRHNAPYLDAYCGEPRTTQNPRGMSRIWHWWQVDDRPGPPVTVTSCIPGDRYYLREAFFSCEACGYLNHAEGANNSGSIGRYCCASCDALLPNTRRPSIHMPRLASRLTLTVTDVRVQRLQEITGRDMLAEGVRCRGCHDVGTGDYSACRDGGCFEQRGDFIHLWNSLHGPDAWGANPWVCALTFTVQRGNIDAKDAAHA